MVLCRFVSVFVVVKKKMIIPLKRVFLQRSVLTANFDDT